MARRTAPAFHAHTWLATVSDKLAGQNALRPGVGSTRSDRGGRNPRPECAGVAAPGARRRVAAPPAPVGRALLRFQCAPLLSARPPRPWPDLSYTLVKTARQGDSLIAERHVPPIRDRQRGRP